MGCELGFWRIRALGGRIQHCGGSHDSQTLDVGYEGCVQDFGGQGEVFALGCDCLDAQVFDSLFGVHCCSIPCQKMAVALYTVKSLAEGDQSFVFGRCLVLAQAREIAGIAYHSYYSATV